MTNLSERERAMMQWLAQCLYQRGCELPDLSLERAGAAIRMRLAESAPAPAASPLVGEADAELVKQLRARAKEHDEGDRRYTAAWLRDAASRIEVLTTALSRASSDGFALGVEKAAHDAKVSAANFIGVHVVNMLQSQRSPDLIAGLEHAEDLLRNDWDPTEGSALSPPSSDPPQRESDRNEIAKLREECEAHASKNNERAAWWFKKGLEAAVEVVDRDCLDFTIKELTGRILALAFPAQRESASDPLVEWLRDMRDHLKEGFMVCDRCGFDMPTKDMDVVDDIDAAINHATGAKALARRAPMEGK